MAQTDVQILHAKPVQTDIHALGHAPGGKVKMMKIIAAEFGADEITLARRLSQRDSEQHFAHATAIERGGVDKVQAGIQGGAYGAKRLVQIDFAELLPQ